MRRHPIGNLCAEREIQPCAGIHRHLSAGARRNLLCRAAIDGNKRVAGMSMLTFLQLNGLTPTVPEMEYYTVMMAVASGQMNKDELTSWLNSAVTRL